MKKRKREGKAYTCRASFLAMTEEVRLAVKQGFNLRVIHEQKHERLGMSYRSFARYVGIYLKGGQERAENTSAAALAPSVAERRPGGGPLKVTAGPVVAQRMHDATGQHDETLV